MFHRTCVASAATRVDCRIWVPSRSTLIEKLLVPQRTDVDLWAARATEAPISEAAASRAARPRGEGSPEAGKELVKSLGGVRTDVFRSFPTGPGPA